jgi:benzil reductase ((S)-benzoin forming)
MRDTYTPELEAALRGAVFVLTGPTSGLGLALYDLLNGAGVPLIAIGRKVERLAHNQDVIDADKHKIALIEADFASINSADWLDESRVKAARMLEAHPEKTFVFLNNAGTIAPLCAAVDIETGALNGAMQINFVAPLTLATTMLKISAENGRHLRIVNITTGAARRPIAGWLAYCAGKAACRMALDVLAIENTDVELLHIDPGVIDTGMQELIRKRDLMTRQSVPPADLSQLRTPAAVAQDVLARAMGMKR